MPNTFLSSLSDQERHDFIDGVFDLARSGDLDALMQMLDFGVPIDVVNTRNDSLLIISAYSQHPRMVKELLNRHADTSVVNSMGQTAISCAVFRNDRQILALLVQAGADPDLGAHTGLEIAQQFELTEMVKLLTKP